jgi:nuclease-like protein/topoisomerase-like DNA binding C4 zinc finger protein
MLREMNHDLIVSLLPISGIILGILSFWRRLPSVVGRRGERRISQVLSTLDPSRFNVLNDVLIASSKGSSQIDHLVFSRRGIFVIETKNLDGWIHGSETSQNWTQTIYRTRNQFLNPIRQNIFHIHALQEALKFHSHIQMYSIVVFAGSGELKNVKVDTPVIYANELISLIESTGTDVLSSEQVQDLYNRVQGKTLVGKEARKRHKYHAQSKAINVQAKIDEGICLRCGGKLILRTGTYGNFLDCSSYPRCRFTLSVGKGNQVSKGLLSLLKSQLPSLWK